MKRVDAFQNHQGYADYYLIHALASRCPTGEDNGAAKDMLPSNQSMLGKCRYFAKKDLVWQVPVFGWSMWAIGMILISRNWTSDAALIEWVTMNRANVALTTATDKLSHASSKIGIRPGSSPTSKELV